MPPTGSSSDTTGFRVVAVALATFVVAMAFGADLGLRSPAKKEKGWDSTRPQSGSSKGIFPWSAPRARKREAKSLNEVRGALSGERKRRVEAERSLSLARTRLGEAGIEIQGLEVRVDALQAELQARTREILELRADVARASIASPEMVEQFITLADQALRKALFDSALELADDAEAMRKMLGASADPRSGARVELIRANAQVALGDDEAAAGSLTRLLDREPGFELDSGRSSPKLVRVFDRVRAERAPIARAPVRRATGSEAAPDRAH